MAARDFSEEERNRDFHTYIALRSSIFGAEMPPR